MRFLSGTRTFLLILAFFTFFLLGLFLSLQPASAQSTQPNSLLPITKDLEITFDTRAERFADLEYILLNPNNKQIDKRILINSPSGIMSQKFQLGDTPDESRPECIIVENNRRIGKCQDGTYTLKLRAIDAAGNTSDYTTSQTERDTVNPDKPKTNITIDQTNHILKATISGEPNSNALIKITTPQTTTTQEHPLDPTGNLHINNLIGTYEPATTYTIEIKIKDRAWNTGQPTTKTITTPDEGFCTTTGNLLSFPLKNNYIPSNNGGFYAMRENRYHAAQDFTYNTPSQSYNQPIYSAGDGLVITSTNGNYWYNSQTPNATTIKIRHQAQGLNTYYVHLNTTQIQPNTTVKTGQQIATMGNTGIVYPKPTYPGDTSGTHLHFAVTIIDPRAYTNYNRTTQYGEIFINPMQLLATKCKGRQGQGNGQNTPNDKDPWAGKKAQDLEQIQINLDINKDGNITYKNLKIPSPLITYQTTQNNSKTAHLYGIAANKNAKATLTTHYEANTGWGFCWTFWNCTEWRDDQKQIQIQHSELTIYKEDTNNPIKTTWNDKENGQWEIQLNLGQDPVNLNDKVYAKNIIHGKETFNHPDKGNIDIDYGSPTDGKNSSQKSNVIQIDNKEELLHSCQIRKYDNENYNKYDEFFIKYTKMWNDEFAPPEKLDCNLVKAMAFRESYLGTGSGWNPKIDIMQVSNPNDPAMKTLRREGKFKESYCKGNKRTDVYYPEAKVDTPEESIKWGILWLFQKTRYINRPGTCDPSSYNKWEDGVKNYNGGGDPQYVKGVYEIYLNGKDIRNGSKLYEK